METYGDIEFDNLFVNKLYCEEQKINIIKTVVNINNNNEFIINNNHNNKIITINSINGCNLKLNDDLLDGFNIEIIFESEIKYFILNGDYIFNNSINYISNYVLGHSIFNNDSYINNYTLQKDGFLDTKNTELKLLLNNKNIIISGNFNSNIIYKITFIDNNILLNNQIYYNLNLFINNIYIFDISNISLKDTIFSLFDKNDNIFNKNVFKVGEEGIENSKIIFYLPLNKLNFNDFPNKLKYGLLEKKKILDTNNVFANYEIDSSSFINIPQKYLNYNNINNNESLKWSIINNNEIKFNYNDNPIISYFKFYYKQNENIINKYNKINRIVFYGSNNNINYYEIFNKSYDLNETITELYEIFDNTIKYNYYKFILNAYSSYSINIFGFEVGINYNYIDKKEIIIN